VEKRRRSPGKLRRRPCVPNDEKNNTTIKRVLTR
jgi:hypothetical protein